MMKATENTPSELAVVSASNHALALQSLSINHPRIKQVMEELDCLIYPNS